MNNDIQGLINILGRIDLTVKYSEDGKTIIIRGEEIALRDIVDAKVKRVHHLTKKIPIDEREKFNFLKGFVAASVIDNPIGYLAGVETEVVYEELKVKRIELVLYLRNKKKKSFICGCFLSTDIDMIDCERDTETICKGILNAINETSNNSNFIVGGKYIVGKDIMLKTGYHSIYYISGEGIVRIYNNEKKEELVFCEYLDAKEKQEYVNVPIYQGSFIDIEEKIVVDFVHITDFSKLAKKEERENSMVTESVFDLIGWIFMLLFKMALVAAFFPFSLIYLWFKYKDEQ